MRSEGEDTLIEGGDGQRRPVGLIKTFEASGIETRKVAGGR